MSEKLTKKYCVEIERDSEEPFNHFFEWSGVPTREDVLKIVMGLDIKYKDEYGRLTFYEIFPEKSVPVPIKPIPSPKSEEVKSCDNCKHYSDIDVCAIAKGVPCARTGKEGDKYGDGTWEFWNIDPQPFDYEKWKIERLAKLDKLYKHFLESRNIPYLTLRELFSSALDELNLKRGGK